MDGALSSDRHHPSDRRSGGSGGYSGGGGYRRDNDRRGPRRGGGRHRHHPYRRDDYGGGRHSGRRYGDRDDRYGGSDRYGGDRYGGGGRGGHRGGRGRGRGPRQPANRFSTETKSVDPQYAMMKQLTAMVAKMGDLGGAAEVAASAAVGAGTEPSNEGSGGLRPVVKAVGTNVSDLVEVLCGPANAPLFLKFGADEAPLKGEENGENAAMEGGESTEKEGKSEEEGKVHEIDASEEAGGLAALLLHCASNLPLQTPSYAALTLGVDAKAPKETHAGFAKRCVELGMRTLGRDLDLMLECTASDGTNGKGGSGDNVGMTEEEQVALLKSKEDQRCLAETAGGFGNGGQIDAYHRAKLTLRYFAHLATVGIVSMEDGGEGSLLGMLETLAEAASRAAHRSSGSKDEPSRALGRAARLLASLLLSTVPYLLRMAGARHRLAELVEALEANVVGSSAGYRSEYDPGCGAKSILLKGELDDVPVGAVEEDEEESDDEEEEDEDEGPSPCADTLQDLLRTVRTLLAAANDGAAGTRFALLDDAPWTALTTAVPPAMPGEPTEGGMDVEGAAEKAPLAYEGEPLPLDLIGGEERRCASIPYLLSIDTYVGEEGKIDVRCRSLDGMVFGRLAIFDAPPSPDDDEDDDEEDEGKEGNPNLDAYVQTYSLADRCLLSDAVRDVLSCHRPLVSDAGAERNTAREVAEHVWAVSHLVKPSAASDDGDGSAREGEEDPANAGSGPEAPSKGIEYGIVETLLSLLAQSTPPASSTPAASPLSSHLYLSRVLLELTKLRPALVAPAIVLAVSGLFNDFFPSLTPTARENLAAWLAFHLANTSYQWPKVYWQHWAPYAAAIENNGRNSRGEFLRSVLWNMAEVSSEGAVTVVKECLPAGSALAESVFLKQLPNEEELAPAERDLINRLWNASDDPDAIRQHVISDELAESYGASASGDDADNSMHHASVWWRARLVARALFYPVKREGCRMAKLTERAWKERSAAEGDGGAAGDDDGAMDEGVDESEDLLADVSDAVSRFKPVILAALARDADAYDIIASGKVDDDALLLAGEVSILNEFGTIVPSWDRSLGNSLIECLLRTKIVSDAAVTRWALGDENSHGRVRPRWWTYVSQALQHSIQTACAQTEASRTDLGGGIGMIVDETGQNEEDPAEAAAARLDEALKTAVPLLTYAVERVCRIVEASGSDNKKVPSLGADAVEGAKRLVDALLFHFRSLVVGSDGVLTAANVQKGFSSMDADGEKLASICRAAIGTCQSEGGKKLLQSLASSLEKMM